MVIRCRRIGEPPAPAALAESPRRSRTVPPGPVGEGAIGSLSPGYPEVREVIGMGRPSGVSRRGWPVLLVALVCIGCVRPTGEISGTVTYRGKPLPSGTVTCLDVNNQALGSSAISQGSYSIARVPVGPVKII